MSYLHHLPHLLHWGRIIRHLLHQYRQQEIRHIWRLLRRV